MGLHILPDDHDAMRETLEDLLETTNTPPLQIELELQVYDLITDTYRRYHESIDQYLAEQAAQLRLINDPVIRQRKQRTSFLQGLSEYGHGPAYIVVGNMNPDDEKHKTHLSGGT